jgi:hypothetical protein
MSDSCRCRSLILLTFLFHNLHILAKPIQEIVLEDYMSRFLSVPLCIGIGCLPMVPRNPQLVRFQYRILNLIVVKYDWFSY